MLFPATADLLMLHTLRQVQSYSRYCRVGVLAVVISLTARFANMTNLPGVIFWFDVTFMNIQYLNGHATISQTCPVVHVLLTVYFASPSLVFQLSPSVFQWLPFSGHCSRYSVDIPPLELCVHLPEQRARCNQSSLAK